MDYAIYLGDAHTVVFKKNEGIVLNEATRVAYTMVGKMDRELKCIAVGNRAKQMQDRSDKKVVVESFVVNGRIVDMRLCKIFLAELMKKVAGEGYRNLKVLICIPCSLTSEEVDAYREVAYSVNVSVVEFVPTVVASAVGAGFNIESAEACLSVYIGEGLTEIAAISFGGIIAGGTIYEGGAEVTAEIAKFIEKKHGIEISEQMAEEARNHSGTLLVNDEVSFRICGMDSDTGEIREAWFNGMDCYKIMLPTYSKITRAIMKVITECSPQVLVDIKEKPIYVGGECSNPTGLREFLTSNLGMSVMLASSNSAISGAGMLLSDKVLLRKIVSAN